MAEEHQHVSECSTNDDDTTIRTGTLWTTIAHFITAIIGSGVLSLAWGTAQLGWIGGPVVLIVFALVTYVSSYLLSNCYWSPDPVTGARNRSFTDAVRVILGKKSAWTSGLLQYVSFFGTGIAYVVTTSACVNTVVVVAVMINVGFFGLLVSSRAILRTNCIHKKGSDADCDYSGQIYMLLFGGVQIVMSQIPDFNSMVLVSVVAAIMSFCYASIGIGLSFAQVVENGKIAGSITGIPAASVAKRLSLTFQALGDIAFAYPYALILLEVQDTIKSPPENKVARKASAIAIIVTTCFYLGCGCFGYAAFGNDTPGNLLTGFGSYEPNWIVKFANVCIIIHLVGGYQIFSQPVFAFVERWLTSKFPAGQFLQKFYKIKLPLVPVFHLNLFRLCFRSSYVAVTTAIAMVFPYFNEILGVLGALNLWPLAIYFPVEMYIVQRNVEVWGKKWVLLKIFSGILMVVSLVALVGSVTGLIEARMN